MRLLIGTPCYGGMLTTQYLTSFVETWDGLSRGKIQAQLFTMMNESLIPRARNKIAQFALEQKFDKLLFIDSDMGWKWEDVDRLIRSDKSIIGGSYPMKGFPMKLALNQLPEAEPATPEGEVEVRHIPTGFMKIDVAVLESLKEHTSNFICEHGTTQKPVRMWDFFPSGVNTDLDIYESEDWGFCTLARKHGHRIWFSTRTITSHTGTYVFDMRNQPSLR